MFAAPSVGLTSTPARVMGYRIRILQITLSIWALMLLADAAYVFIDRSGALARWKELQLDVAGQGASIGDTTVDFEVTGVAALGIDLYAAAVLTFAIVGLVAALLWRAAHRPEARVLAVFLSLLMMPGMLLEVVGVPRQTYLYVASGLAFLNAAAFVRFAALFPRPLAPAELAARRAWVRGLQAAALRPGPVWAAAGVLGALTMGLSFAAGPAGGSLGLLTVVPLLVGVALLRRSYRIAGAEERRKLLWVVQGFYTGAWVLALGFIAMMVVSAGAGFASAANGGGSVSTAGLLVFTLGVELAILIVLCSLAFALFYHGAIEPGLVIQKTTIYGILTVGGAATFGLVENLASDVVLEALSLPQSWGGPIAGAVVAGAVTLLRQRVGGWVNRRFPAAGGAQAA